MRLAILITIIALSFSNVQSQVYKTLEVEFTRIFKDNKSENVVKGYLYYDGFKYISITTEPLKQWMIFNNNELLIYYPDEKKAINIKSEYPVNLPFFQTFIGLNDDNFGLAKLGYTISKNEMQGDSLFVHWQPPQNAQKVLGEFILILKSNRIVRIDSKSPRGNLIGQTCYGNYLKHGKRSFPLEIKSILYADDNITTESIIYNNPVFDVVLPAEISQFTLPAGTAVKEVEW